VINLAALPLMLAVFLAALWLMRYNKREALAAARRNNATAAAE
jgi:hypothetical protein